MEYKRKRLIRAALQKAEAKRKQTVRQAESAADTEQQTPEEYAQTVVSEKAAQAAENLQSKALDTGRISYRQFRILQEKRQRVPTTHAAQPAETESPPFAQSADRRESFKRQRFRQKALDKREIKTPDSYRDKMQALKRQHLTRETVRRHLQKQAGGTVLGSGVRLPDTVPASSGGIRQAALGRIRTLLQAAWLRLKAILTRTIRRAAGSLLALLGAGGVVLLLAMVIGAAAAVIGSPMGIPYHIRNMKNVAERKNNIDKGRDQCALVDMGISNTADTKMARPFSQMPAWKILLGTLAQVNTCSFTLPKRSRIPSIGVTTRTCRDLAAKKEIIEKISQSITEKNHHYRKTIAESLAGSTGKRPSAELRHECGGTHHPPQHFSSAFKNSHWYWKKRFEKSILLQ